MLPSGTSSASTQPTTSSTLPTGPIDYSAAIPYQQAAQQANANVANLTTSSPSLLQALQQNLTKIFTTDNPLINARESALTNYLNTPSQTRADLLPSNLPVVAGSNLNLSPTQQNAIVQGRQNAALVPLAGLNSSVVGMYGNIPQLVQRAGDIYSSLIQGETMRAQNLRQQFEDIIGMSQAQKDAQLRQLQIALTAQGNPNIQANKVLQAAGAAVGQYSDPASFIAAFGNNPYVTHDQLLGIYNSAHPGTVLTPTQALTLQVTPQAAGIQPLTSVSVKHPGPFPFLPGFLGYDTTQTFNPLTGSYDGSAANSNSGFNVMDILKNLLYGGAKAAQGGGWF